jgi:hypothetical protein
MRSCGICGGQNTTGVGFLPVLRFPLPILIQPMFHTHLPSGAGTVVPLVAEVPSGIRVTPPPPE